MRRVGLIVNPQSGKDIRRTVGGATTASYQDKVDLIRRIITGLVNGGVEEALMMSDPTGMARRARNGLDDEFAEAARVLEMWSDGTAEDTDRAVDAGEKRGGPFGRESCPASWPRSTSRNSAG